MDEAILLAQAAGRHGVIGRQDALAAGLSRQAIDRRVATGRWRRVGNGAYVVAGTPPTWPQAVTAACVAGGADVVASHRTAARLWGLVAADGRTELTVAGNRRVRIPGVRVHQSILLPGLDQTVVDGVPATTLPRTLADVAGHQDPRVVGQWVDDAMRRHRLDLRELRSCFARLSGPGRRDLRPLRAALDVRLPGWDPGDSALEARALRILADAGLPAPVQQHPVRRLDGETAEIDLAFPPEWVAIELDGWEHHGRRSAFSPDRIRRNELVLLGWDVYQFTWEMSDGLFLRTVTRALDRARARTTP